jgi:hypothetical protein
MRIRPGGPGDIAAVLALGDEAVTWMNARENTQQWGTAPWTGSQQREAVIRDLAHGGGMRIAEDPDDGVLGVLVITGTPQPYVPAAASTRDTGSPRSRSSRSRCQPGHGRGCCSPCGCAGELRPGQPRTSRGMSIARCRTDG